MKKNKKAYENMPWLVVIFALLLIFFVIYAAGFFDFWGKGLGTLNDQVQFGGDADNDGVINGRDKCPCDPGEIENDGCRLGHDSMDNENRDCLEKDAFS